MHEKRQQAFGYDVMSRAKDFHWHKTFADGRTLVEDERRHG
jgi:hypothetical protein